MKALCHYRMEATNISGLNYCSISSKWYPGICSYSLQILSTKGLEFFCFFKNRSCGIYLFKALRAVVLEIFGLRTSEKNIKNPGWGFNSVGRVLAS